MIGSREFRELLVADVALVRGAATARDVAMALQRYWEDREGSGIVADLCALTRKDRSAFAAAEAEADRLIAEAGGDSRLALTRRGGVDRSIHVALSAVGTGLSRSLGEAGAAARAPLRPMPPDRYVDFTLAGEGGMGVVYMALDTELNRLVALKMVRPDAGHRGEAATPGSPIEASTPRGDTPASRAFEELKARFLQEAWVTGGLEHPGIVPVYELGQTPRGIPYYTMRFVRGQRTLRQAIDERTGAAFDDRLALVEPFLKVCDTVRYAHARGVVHRDLKPENVALGEFGEVVILDWGLAKLAGREDMVASRWQERVAEFREAGDLRTVAGALGTPGYMSPEAALGRLEEVDAKSDVYSLGVMLYEILTGRTPYTFTRYVEYLDALRQGDPAPATAVAPEVPPPLSDLCASALARDRARRPETADALARQVRAWQVASALDREVDQLLRDARVSLAAAVAVRGDDRLRQVDRAAAALGQAGSKRPDHPDLPEITAEMERVREGGLRERERASGRRMLRRVGIIGLAAAAAVAFLVAAMLDAERREAQAAKATAERARDEVLRLSDGAKVRNLEDRASRLGLAEPDVLASTEAWLAEVRALVARLPQHQEALEAIRGRARAPGPPWAFEDPALEWQHGILADLVDRLRGLEAEEAPQYVRVAGMRRRALEVRQSMDRNAELWRAVVEAVAADPRFGGVRMKPQPGLVPLGPDPASGLLEFAHEGSGTVPVRSAETGRLELRDDSALVLVLIPGGEFAMGAQAGDAAAARHDPGAAANEAPVHTVRLSLFLLSKFECTQAQWSAMSRTLLRSDWSGPRRPVARVSYRDVGEVLPTFGLRLPSEAQWEYACRGGPLEDAAGSGEGAGVEERAWFEENAGRQTQEVGRKGANALGLHDMLGNVWEWCEDAFDAYDPGRAADPVVQKPGWNPASVPRVIRGGAWSSRREEMRPSGRMENLPLVQTEHVGFRPARSVATE